MNNWKEQLRKLQEHDTKNLKKLTDNSFRIGKIISLDLNKSDGIEIKGGYATRKKYIVIIGVSEDNIIGVVLINHAINFNALPTKELQDCQYPIKKDDYAHILTANSFIDCSEIFELNKERVKQEGEDEKDLTELDKELVIGCLKESEVIAPKMKKKYGLL